MALCFEGTVVQEQKWYSNDLTLERISSEKLDESYAVIKNSNAGLLHEHKAVAGTSSFYRNTFGVSLDLWLASNWLSNFELTSQQDINQLLRRTHSNTVADLEGKVVEIYFRKDSSGHANIQGLSVPEAIPYEFLQTVLAVVRKK